MTERRRKAPPALHGALFRQLQLLAALMGVPAVADASALDKEQAVHSQVPSSNVSPLPPANAQADGAAATRRRRRAQRPPEGWVQALRSCKQLPSASEQPPNEAGGHSPAASRLVSSGSEQPTFQSSWRPAHGVALAEIHSLQAEGAPGGSSHQAVTEEARATRQLGRDGRPRGGAEGSFGSMALLQARALAVEAFERGKAAAALHPIYLLFMVLCIMMFAILFMLLLYAAYMDEHGPIQARSGTRERAANLEERRMPGSARVSPPMPIRSPRSSPQDAAEPPPEAQATVVHSPGDEKLSSPQRQPQTSSSLVSPRQKSKAHPDVPLLAGLQGVGLQGGEGSGTGTLCPRMVVPNGMEFMFVVPEALTRGRQDTTFSVKDINGRALSHVVAREERRGGDCGLYVQMLDKTLLAWVRTSSVHNNVNGEPEICKPDGSVFCNIARDTTSPNTIYHAREAGSGRRMLAFIGDFADKAVNIVNAQGKLAGSTERKLLELDHMPYYVVRVAPKEDACLLLCGLIAIDKLESWMK